MRLVIPCVVIYVSTARELALKNGYSSSAEKVSRPCCTCSLPLRILSSFIPKEMVDELVAGIGIYGPLAGGIS
jgi:hypothetical protein